ncbi:MAG: phage tail tube protein [Bacteroides xylanisolvens]
MAGPVKHDSNADIYRGQLFMFRGVDKKPIAFGTDASLSVSTEEVDVSNKMVSGGWKVSLPGIKSFTASSESLLTYATDQESHDSILKGQIAGETFPFILGQAVVTNQTPTGGEFALDTSKPYYKGTVMTTSLEVKSTNGSISTCSASFTGVGALEIVEPETEP